MQTLIERHGFELTLAETCNSDDEFIEVNFGDLALEIRLQSLGFGLARDSALVKNRWRDSNVLKELVEQGQGVTCGKGHKCGGVSDDQHPASGPQRGQL